MNETLVKLCLGCGLFFGLGFIHVVVDFVFQTHYEAMNKHDHAWIRARHCLIYTVGFIPALLYLHHLAALSWLEVLISTQILFWSHFGEDTYYPVVLWAKYIRRPPEMLSPDMRIGFIKWIDSTLGKLLMIIVDQIIHFAFLIPIVWMVFN